MSKHPLIGKLCQYKSEHRDKVLFTHNIAEKDIYEILYMYRVWDHAKKLTGSTMIPSWFYMKYKEEYGDVCSEEPREYHTPYAILPQTLPSIFNPEAVKIKSFLIVDSKSFISKIGKIVAGQRTILKVLYPGEDIVYTYWMDQDWIEPYSHTETYMDQLKARMLNKMRQNT